MKTILLSVLCTLTLNVQSMEVKKDTIDKYVIDKQIIERFDGTQLEGKTISKYIIAYKNVGNMVEKNHIIITEKHGITLNGKPVKIMKYEGLIIIDGKEATTNELSQLKAEEIAKMENYKAGSKVAESYGEKAEKGVLWITSKNNKTSENIYFIDGRRAEKDEVDKLSPNKIASVKVNKKEGNSVIEVTTKK
ncbi:MAG: hypothetical protein IJB61_11655 [Bacteroides sp]|nr:hypothetical protein [Bacteroides sp.]